MDWDFDGKHDYKDDAFYNNVINSENEEEKETYTNYSNDTSWWADKFFSVIGWTLLILLVSKAAGFIVSSIVWICWIVKGKRQVNKCPTSENVSQWVKFLIITILVVGLMMFSLIDGIVNP